MANSQDSTSMALFCDFENLALGVRDAQYDKFDIRPVLERLLLKGSIVVKKAYCDWERYKGFKATMHEANFELIEIPHVRQSGKNSADIRLVVDALDLCYTKAHVDTFVILSGDSDFSPLVSKLRENAKKVIGVGVKQSTSDLLVANCDEFIFYDELVRESQRHNARREPQAAGGRAQPQRSPAEEQRRREENDQRRSKGIEIAVATFDALQAERGDSGKIWASVLKEAIKRRRPDFSESRYGFRAFGNLLEEAGKRGLLEFGRDEKSGTYVYRNAARGELPAAPQVATAAEFGYREPMHEAGTGVGEHVEPGQQDHEMREPQDEQDRQPPREASPRGTAAPRGTGSRRGRGRGGARQQDGAGQPGMQDHERDREPERGQDRERDLDRDHDREPDHGPARAEAPEPAPLPPAVPTTAEPEATEAPATAPRKRAAPRRPARKTTRKASGDSEG